MLFPYFMTRMILTLLIITGRMEIEIMRIAFVLASILLLTGCGNASIHNQIDKQPSQPAMATTQPETAQTLVPAAEPPIVPKLEEPEKTLAEKLLETMTLEERVGQLFMYAFRGEGMTEFNNVMAKTLDEYKPSGVILFSENVNSKAQVSKLIDDLKNHSKVPIFVSVDEEGGRVTRVGKLYDEQIPAADKTASPEVALERGKELGRRLKELGFNMNFAPVADINTNPANTVIGSRAFSSNPETAAEYVTAAVSGMKSEGIIPAIKHFPGHGDTKEDSHHGIAVYQGDIDRLMGEELVPFIAGIDVGVDVVMVGHINAPIITEDALPATFSKKLITDILRGQLGFDGVVITDAMDMGAITKYYPPGEAAVAAIEAGIDIILMPADVHAAYTAVLEAARSGRLPEDRINASVLRILELKNKL